LYYVAWSFVNVMDYFAIQNALEECSTVTNICKRPAAHEPEVWGAIGCGTLMIGEGWKIGKYKPALPLHSLT
jgi:hypothetical protein